MNLNKSPTLNLPLVINKPRQTRVIKNNVQTR